MTHREHEPTPLAGAIESNLQRASTRAPRALAYKLAGRSVPLVAIRPTHARGRDRMCPELLALMRELAAGNRPWPLYLWSRGPGTGKTSAALTLLDHYAPSHPGWMPSAEGRELMAGFIDFAGLPRIARAAEFDKTDGRLWERIRQPAPLVLDDLRKPGDREQRLGDDHYGLLKRVLDLRVGLPLVITSNLDPWEPAEGGTPELVRVFDDRVADRIVCGTVFELAGDSRRGQ